MKLTVGIPTFNRAELLTETIESVLAQSFTHFRLIVSDNASDDDTPEVVRSFGDERITYVRSEHNIGAIANLNRLIALVDTEFLVLLPDDDILYPGHLEAAVGLLERFESVGLAHSAFDLIDAGSRVIGSMSPLSGRSLVSIERRDRVLERLMVSDFPLGFSSIAYRTKAIVEAGGFRSEEEPFGDLQLWMRIARDWDFGYIAKPLAACRMHQATITRDIGRRHGVTSDGRELVLLHAQQRFQRRMSFLGESRLGRGGRRRLRALATLHFLVDRAYWGLSWRAVLAGQRSLVRIYPRIVFRRSFWRLAVAQLGGRRVRLALRRAAVLRGRPREA